MFRRTTFHIASLALLSLSACQSAPKPLSLSVATLTVDYDLAAAANSSPPAASACAVRLLAVRGSPPGTPIAQAAAAIVVDRGTPFRGKSQLPIGSRWLNPEQTQAWLEQLATRPVGSQQQLGLVKAVLRTDLIVSIRATDASNPSLATVAELPILRLQHSTSGWQISLLTPEAAEVRNQWQAEPAHAPQLTAQHEVLALQGTLGDREVALFVPDPRIPDGGLLLLLQPSDSATDELVAAADQTARAKQPTPPATAPLPVAWQVARSAVGEDNRRPALLACVTPLHLDRGKDLILAADEAALIAMTEQLGRVDAKSEQVAWLVEIAIWQALIPRLEREELAASLQAACWRHLGALASDASTLQLLLKMSRDGESFLRGLVEENLAALADRSAAVRVAAVTWLHGQGIVCAGYDAMADKNERRHALRQFQMLREAGQ